ncbi:MAG: hypothetical protein MR375_08445 [Veillonellaceae bacterium]|nr:hypothetical protein [Veillonellaceae bacterium]
MYFKKLMSAMLSGVFLISTMGTAAAEVPQTVEARLTTVESDTYGGEQTGALIDRINHLERDYEGKHSNGSMLQRVNYLYGNLYENQSGPSLMTKLNAIEWGIRHEVSRTPVQNRITELETKVQGKTTDGSYRSRITKLGTYAFGGNALPITQVTLPENTLIKIALSSPVNAKELKKGDTVRYEVAEDVVIDGVLLFTKGSPGEGVVTDVTQARNFGRNAKIDIDFKTLQAMDGTRVDAYIGEKAKKEMKNLAMAAGASLAGIAVLGPVGIIGGVFVKGKNIDLPAGTEVYVQTSKEISVYGVQTVAE